MRLSERIGSEAPHGSGVPDAEREACAAEHGHGGGHRPGYGPLWGASVSSDLDEARSALDSERAAVAVLAQPVSEAALTGAAGRLVVGRDGQAVLVVSDVPPVPAGKTYQLWVIDGGRPTAAGLFAPGSGTLAIPIDGSVAKGSVVAVTVEDDGGADAPTGKPVIASAPVSVS